MRRIWIVVAMIAMMFAGLTGAPVAEAANTYPTNPLGFAYGGVQNVENWYGHPTGMVITGRCNRYAAEFANARANGAEILAYIDVPERPDSLACSIESGLYGDPATTPLWPYPTYGTRTNWPNTHLTDMRVGSVWVNSVVKYIENLMVEDKVDGVFLDVVGARLWSSRAAWDSWPQWEKDAWTAGNIDLVRRLDASRRALNPRFIIVNNNVWDVVGTAGRDAEPYVDGICLEHHSLTPYHTQVAGRPYSNLGHRRVLIIANSTADAKAWADVQGVTHVSDQQTYQQVTTPPIGFNRLTDRPKKFGRTTVAATNSLGMAANQKRGSKFTLNDKGTLLSFSAYLDGNGGATGTQSVRMVLYRDNAAVPGARVAQSNTITITSGAAGRWVDFSAPATTLNPGQYWIVIHTGGTERVARNRGDGAPNWYGNADTFSDGPADPFGTGSTGNVTLSVNVSYTVGH